MTPLQLRIGLWLAILMIAAGIGLRIHQETEKLNRHFDRRADENARGVYDRRGWGSSRRFEIERELAEKLLEK
jgi:hypothetical protein